MYKYSKTYWFLTEKQIEGKLSTFPETRRQKAASFNGANASRTQLYSTHKCMYISWLLLV